MGGTHGRSSGRGGVLSCALPLAALALLVAATAAQGAGITASRHNFPANAPLDFAVEGACSACHIPHNPGDPPGEALLWSRDLVDEATFYSQNGSPLPNFVPGKTLLCYDCHDDMISVPDRVPDSGVWTSGRTPQDIALGGTAAGQPLGGYYENADGTVPPPVTSGVLVTGGHYWRSDPSDSPDLRRQGDKIECEFCHDPHNLLTGDNEAFFLTRALDGQDLNQYGTDLRSSKNLTRFPSDPQAVPNGSRWGTGTGREMCATCHGYADDGNQLTFYSVQVPIPPAGVPEHSVADTTNPCIWCHPHNRPEGCNGCHGYPPLVATDFDRVSNPDGQSYAGGAGAHRRHLDVLGTAIFKCEICHGPDPGRATTYWHATGGADVQPGNVDIMGETAYWGAGGGYTGQASAVNPVPTGYAFVAKGGTDQRCSGLDCHGNPPDVAGALNWTDDLVDEVTGDPVGDGLDICKWCHDATPARIGAGVGAPNVLGDATGGGVSPGDWRTGFTWGADVNGHGLAAGNYEKDLVGEASPAGLPAANKGCAVCHDARYTDNPPPALNTPLKPHYGAANKRLKDQINGVAIADNADATCIACHQTAIGPDTAANSQVARHGNSTADGYIPIEQPQPAAQFVRDCRQCHEPHGANWNMAGTRNLHMVGKWLDVDGNGLPNTVVPGAEAARVDSDATTRFANITPADLPVNFRSSGNPTPTYPDVPVNRADDSMNDGFNDGVADSVCVVCHVSLERNFSQVGDTTLQGTGHLPVGTQCRLCHKHQEGADDAFGPLECYACHGTTPGAGSPPTRYERQYWPDGRPSAVSQFDYANDRPGAHRQHVEAIAFQLFGETLAQLVTDLAGPNPTLTSRTKQIAICAFCHYNPGQGENFDHSVNFPQPLGDDRVDVYDGTAAHYFRKFTIGAGPYLGRTNYADDTTGGGYNYGTDSCANLVCHNQNPTPPRAGGIGSAPGWGTPPNWAPGANTKCQNTTCHAAPATYTLSHPKHVAGGAGQKNYECRECHADNGTNLQHGNGKVDMQGGAAPWLWNNPATVEGSFGGADGFYDKDDSTAASAGDTAFGYKVPPYDPCNAVYCHGDDNGAGQLPAADRGTDTTPVWGTASTAACGTCHRASAASPPGSLSHPKHAGSAAGQYAIACQACHYGTTTDGVNIASQTLHVNTSVEVSFNNAADARVDATSSYLPPGDTVLGSGYGACASTYCHSRGNDLVAPYNNVPLSVPIAALPAWGAAGPLACSTCHGNPAPTPPADASMPDYADGTPKANQHVIHSAANQFDCQICHYPTTAVADTIASTALHVNRAYDAGPNPAGAALYQFAWASPNCESVICHGGNGGAGTALTPLNWTTGPYGCRDCHGMVGGALTDTDVDDFAWAGATPVMSKIGNAEYAADGGGHGDATPPNAPNRACADCHDSAAGHDTTAALTGTNPFRLDDQDGVVAGVQYSCSFTTGCHAAGINGPQTGVDISLIKTHSEAAMEAPPQTVPAFQAKRTWPAWSVGLSCVNCHDPHGDGNRSMINRWVYDKGAFALPAPSPALPTEQLGLAFTDDTTGVGAGSFASGSDYSGICQECHEDPSVVSFKDGTAVTPGSVSAANHPSPGENPGDCSDCHRHDVGFRPTRCEDCHNGTVALAPDVMPFYNINGHGAYGVDCTDCHQVGSPTPKTHLTGTLETYAFPGSSFGGPNTNTAHLNGSFFGTVNNDRDWQLNFDNNCYLNAACHAQGSTPIGHRHELTHKNGVVRFGDHSTVVDPKRDRSPLTYWTPWTIRDITTNAPAPSPPTRNQYAPCVACHDPHGADYSGYTYSPEAPDGDYHMLRENLGDPDYFCNSNCHRP